MTELSQYILLPQDILLGTVAAELQSTHYMTTHGFIWVIVSRAQCGFEVL